MPRAQALVPRSRVLERRKSKEGRMNLKFRGIRGEFRLIAVICNLCSTKGSKRRLFGEGDSIRESCMAVRRKRIGKLLG